MANGMRIPTTADLMSMWNASGLKEKLIFDLELNKYISRINIFIYNKI